MSGKEIIAYLLAEGRVILQAPVAFATCVLILLVLVWGAMNWRYSGQIDNLKSQVDTKEGVISSKNALLSDYKDKLSGATPDEARRRLDALELQVAALSPRRLSEKQKEQITKSVSAIRGRIAITCDMAVADAAPMAKDLSLAFQMARWYVEVPKVLAPGNPPQSGLALRVQDLQKLSQLDLEVKNALDVAGIAFDLQGGLISMRTPNQSAVPGMPPQPDVEILVTVR